MPESQSLEEAWDEAIRTGVGFVAGPRGIMDDERGKQHEAAIRNLALAVFHSLAMYVIDDTVADGIRARIAALGESDGD